MNQKLKNKSLNWLKEFYDILHTYKLPANEMISSGGILKITFGTASDSLIVEVFPKSISTEGFQLTEKYTVRYQGTKSLTEIQTKILLLLISILKKIEKNLPEEFYDSEGIGLEKEDPAKRIVRLFPFCTIENFEKRSFIPAQILVRYTFKCNQKCPYCSSPLPVKEPDLEKLMKLFDLVADTIPGAIVTITGGEPTLRVDLANCVKYLIKRKEISTVEIQTNAVTFAEKDKLRDFPQSNRLRMFVSLHSLNEQVYDICTGSKKLLNKAITGIQNLLNCGHKVILNIVLNKFNVDELTNYIEEIEKRFSKPKLDELHFSILMCPPHRSSAPLFLVKYSYLKNKLESAVSLAEKKGFYISPLLSSSYASIPPCILSDKYRKRPDMFPIHNPEETGYEDFSKSWIKAKKCVECRENHYCLGLPRPYIDRFGLSELKPV